MSNTAEKLDCIIVGAGISGLLAALVLKRAGAKLLVLEKGRGVGGRMATRRRDGAVFDHGAQFFTARDSRFEAWVKRWQELGLVVPWYDLPGSGVHYRGVPGMAGIAKHLVRAEGLDVLRGIEVEEASYGGGRWTVRCRDDQNYSARSLLLTAPVPQSLMLLDAGGFRLPQNHRHDLEAIRFHRCIAALAILESRSALEAHGGALKLDGQPIRWIADNQRKGISPIIPSATIHSTAEFAEEYWDVADAVRLPKLLAAAAPHLGVDVVSCEGHRWGFSQPVDAYPEECFCERESRLAIAGDGLAGGRVESAAISGLAAAQELLSLLTG